MRKLKARISVMPIHAIVMCLASIFSFVSLFIPMFELYVKFTKRSTYSLFSLLLHPRVYLNLREGSVNLDFQMFAAVMFIVTIIVSVAALTLALGFQLYSEDRSRKRWGCLSVMVLFLMRIGVHVYTLSRFVTKDMMTANGLDSKKLYVVQSFMGNMLVIVLVIGAIACLYGALGLKMHMKLLSYPYFIWVVIFTILPLFLILFRAFFASKAGGGYEFTMDGFNKLFDTKTITTWFYGCEVTLQEYFSVFIRSLDYAVWTTVGCLLVGYPLAYILAEKSKKLHKTSSRLLLLFVLPMWMNTMLRTYAWRAFFSETGVLNTMLLTVGVIDEPFRFLANQWSLDIITKIVMVNDFLPFMILPMYSVMVKIDPSLAQAAADLGANRAQTFMRVVFPLSLPGVISGIQMVFMPSMTFYMIPDIISEGNKQTIGNTIQTFIFGQSTAMQQAGNALSLLLLIFVLITMGILRNQDKEAAGGGMAL